MVEDDVVAIGNCPCSVKRSGNRSSRLELRWCESGFRWWDVGLEGMPIRKDKEGWLLLAFFRPCGMATMDSQLFKVHSALDPQIVLG